MNDEQLKNLFSEITSDLLKTDISKDQQIALANKIKDNPDILLYVLDGNDSQVNLASHYDSDSYGLSDANHRSSIIGIALKNNKLEFIKELIKVKIIDFEKHIAYYDPSENRHYTVFGYAVNLSNGFNLIQEITQDIENKTELKAYYSKYQLEIQTSFTDKKFRDNPEGNRDENEYILHATLLYYAIEKNKIDIAKFLLQNQESFEEFKGYIWPNESEVKLSYILLEAIEKDENFIDLFKKSINYDYQQTMISYDDGFKVTALYQIIKLNKLDILKSLHKEGEKISQAKALVLKNKKHISAFEVAFESALKQGLTDIFKFFIEIDKLDINFKINCKSGKIAALQYVLELYKQNMTQQRRSALQNPLNVIKILLENGASYSCIETDRDCPHEIKGEIDKIKETKKIYDGDQDAIRKILQSPPSEIDNKINLEYLKLLFKESGIPKHLMPITQTYPDFKISKIIKEIATPIEDFSKDLDLTLGILSNSLYPNLFPLNAGYIFLTQRNTQLGAQIAASQRDLGKISDEKKTIDSYKTKPHLQTNNFLQINDESKIAGLFLLAPEAKELLFQMSKKWILPKALHLKIKSIKQKLSSVPPSAENAILHVNNELTETKVELTETKQRVESLEQRLIKLETIISQQKKEEPLQEQAPTRKILDYFPKKTPAQRGGEIVTEGSEVLQVSVGQKRPRDDGQPSITFEPSGKKVLTTETPSRSKS